MEKQATRAVLASERTFSWGWENKGSATFAIGAKCKLAVNQDAINGLLPYWIEDKPMSLVGDAGEFASWMHNQGFLVDAHEVVPQAPRKIKRKSS